ncbi:hypothetical protein ACN47E_009901 [Coniothyrium glycines]
MSDVPDDSQDSILCANTRKRKIEGGQQATLPPAKRPLVSNFDGTLAAKYGIVPAALAKTYQCLEKCLKHSPAAVRAASRGVLRYCGNLFADGLTSKGLENSTSVEMTENVPNQEQRNTLEVYAMKPEPQRGQRFDKKAHNEKTPPEDNWDLYAYSDDERWIEYGSKLHRSGTSYHTKRHLDVMNVSFSPVLKPEPMILPEHLVPAEEKQKKGKNKVSRGTENPKRVEPERCSTSHNIQSKPQQPCNIILEFFLRGINTSRVPPPLQKHPHTKKDYIEQAARAFQEMECRSQTPNIDKGMILSRLMTEHVQQKTRLVSPETRLNSWNMQKTNARKKERSRANMAKNLQQEVRQAPVTASQIPVVPAKPTVPATTCSKATQTPNTRLNTQEQSDVPQQLVSGSETRAQHVPSECNYSVCENKYSDTFRQLDTDGTEPAGAFDDNGDLVPTTQEECTHLSKVHTQAQDSDQHRQNDFAEGQQVFMQKDISQPVSRPHYNALPEDSRERIAGNIWDFNSTRDEKLATCLKRGDMDQEGQTANRVFKKVRFVDEEDSEMADYIPEQQVEVVPVDVDFVARVAHLKQQNISKGHHFAGQWPEWSTFTALQRDKVLEALVFLQGQASLAQINRWGGVEDAEEAL